MGICYTYFLYDGFDWGYENINKNDMIKKLKKYSTILSDSIPHFIVVDIDKKHPTDFIEEIKKDGIVYDMAFEYSDDEEHILDDYNNIHNKSIEINDIPTHEEIMTKWWGAEIKGEPFTWFRIIGFMPSINIKNNEYKTSIGFVFSGRNIFSHFISSDIPPEIKKL